MPTVDPNEERTSKYNPTFSILWSWNMIGGYTEMFSDLYKQYLFFQRPLYFCIIPLSVYITNDIW